MKEVLDVLKNLSVLYVDDSKVQLKAGKEYLKKFFKNVDVCDSFEKAVELIKENHYDVVITDIVMPGKDGFELVKEIKLNFPDIIVVFLSSFFDTTTLIKAIDVGVDGFLIKPFNENNFLKTFYNIFKYKNLLRKQESLLRQYKDIVDKNLIVSKTDKNGVITYVNEAFEKISGFKKEELIGKPHSIVRHPDMKDSVFKELWETITQGKVWKGLIKNRKKNGEAYYVDSVIQPIFDEYGNIKEYIALRKDVTNFISAELLIKDKLALVEEAMLVLVKILDYKNLEVVMDEDTLKKYKIRLTKMIKRYLRKYFNDIEEYEIEKDVLGFLIVDYKEKVNELRAIMNEILKKVINRYIVANDFEIYSLIKMSIAYGKGEIYANASLGLEEILNTEENIIFANGLLAEKKIEIMRNMSMLKTINKALREKRVISLFQPIVDNKTKEIIKFESLVRILDEDGNLITPYFFLDIAKKAGIYGQITLAVLENCFEAYSKYGISISINISPRDVLRDIIREKIYEFLKKTNIKEGEICFELLEGEIIKYPEKMKEFLEEVRKFGAIVAIDDFGSGYSNFIRLVDTNAKIVKIDGSLIKDIHLDKKKQNIVESIVNFAKKEGIKTVAEFVENEEIYNIVKKLGVDCSQGYYFSKPLKMEEIGEFLKNMV